MATSMRMAPAETADGLASAGATRASAASSGVPGLSTGTYIAPYTAELVSMLAASTAEVTTKVGSGLAASAGSVAAVEGTEQPNAAALST